MNPRDIFVSLPTHSFLTTIKPVRDVFADLDSFGINFIIPENASFGTVVGAALYEELEG